MSTLRQRVAGIVRRLDLPALETRLTELEKAASQPGFWDDSRKAQALSREMAGIRDDVDSWRDVESGSESLEELAQMAIEEADESLTDTIRDDYDALIDRVQKMEFAVQLSGEYDERPAIISLKQGAGGVEAQDWVQMLLRMYLRWSESRGFKAAVLESTPGDETGLKSATAQIDGRYAYGYLKSERGVHRMVRLSPFDADHMRHTTFALVEVLPQPEDQDTSIDINPDDLRIDTFRAGGHGGQNVQKNDTAVRITHIPSNIVVSVQNERSQLQNRAVAMRILTARLMDIQMQEAEAERVKLKGAHVAPEWGRQVRSYVLHPYKMVKDHRSGYETADAEGVLEGGIDGLLEAFLLHSVGAVSDS
ncbi:MAG: peptide chain release factor 2 [Dehalococcoidia bacterium]|nr:peptide chain release factor 2 [Dehalococcoidia bacterium]